MTARTYDAGQVADLLGVSTWAIYESVRRGECPVDPIRVGRRLVWPRAAVDRLLGISPGNDEAGPSEGPATSTSSTAPLAKEEDHHDRTLA